MCEELFFGSFPIVLNLCCHSAFWLFILMSCGSFVFVKTKIKMEVFLLPLKNSAWLRSSHQVIPITANHCRTSTGGGGEEESVAGAHC